MVLFLFLLQIILVLQDSIKVSADNLFKCPPGYLGEHCDNVCPQGKFGDNCRFECACQNGAYCDPVDGECDCIHFFAADGKRGDRMMGWEGLLCDRPCRKGYHSHLCGIKCPCVTGQGECNPHTGECQCLRGFENKECALTCNRLKYDINCNKNCECSQNSDGCDHITGRCNCKEGWHGWICDSKCKDGFWGENCNQTCNCGPGDVPCKYSNGTVCHCPPGWAPDKNGQCTARCPNGTYGYGCEESCKVWKQEPYIGNNTMAGESCNPETGDLICSPGYEGVNCWNSCPFGKYGPNCEGVCRCLNGDCHHVTGECRCYKGWRGSICSERCPIGTYGYNCTLKCIRCHNGGNCVSKEVCQCENGWTGIHCNKSSNSMEDFERTSMRISLTVGALLLVIILVILLFYARISRTEQSAEYHLTQVDKSEVTRIDSQEDIVFDGLYRNMVRIN